MDDLILEELKKIRAEVEAMHQSAHHELRAIKIRLEQIKT